MKINISINGVKQAVAEVKGKGHLATHLNLDDKKGTGSPKIEIITAGFDINNEKETKYLEWHKTELSAGDEVTISILPKDIGDSDPPKQISLSSDPNQTMVDDAEIADKILDIAYDYDHKLYTLINEVKDNLSSDDLSKLKKAIGHILAENFSRLMKPIYRKHPDKVPEELKDMPL